jgi:A/G-specific adenine glycosylase
MPWKGEKDPYKIWLSEIILQQTRVEQGWNYYLNFIQKYPSVIDLANAKDEEAFKLWEGLGYYNRCKNLLFTARQIANRYQGNFPNDYETILSLKGIGPYTAAAIASFAFNLPHAVIDGNVFRVLSRVFGIHTPIDSIDGKKTFSILAEQILDIKSPGLYNQAIMDFGATVCKPLTPLCTKCAMKKICKAFKSGTVNELPVKEKTLLKKNRWMYYFLFEYDGRVLIHKRTNKDIWENLFEFYLIESADAVKWNDEEIKAFLQEQLDINRFQLQQVSELYKQQLTHQNIKGQFIRIKLLSIPKNLKNHQWILIDETQQLAFPKFINQYLNENKLM